MFNLRLSYYLIHSLSATTQFYSFRRRCPLLPDFSHQIFVFSLSHQHGSYLYQAAKMAPKLKSASNYQAWSDYLIYTLSKHFPDAYQALSGKTPHPELRTYASTEIGVIKAYLAEKLDTQASMVSTEDVNLGITTRDKQNKVAQAQYERDVTQWNKADSAASDFIVWTFEEGPQQAIIHAGSSHQMWHDLSELYGKKGTKSAKDYRRQLVTLTYKEDGSPKIFIHKFRTLVRNIRRVETFPAWLEHYYFFRAIRHVGCLLLVLGQGRFAWIVYIATFWNTNFSDK